MKQWQGTNLGGDWDPGVGLGAHNAGEDGDRCQRTNVSLRPVTGWLTDGRGKAWGDVGLKDTSTGSNSTRTATEKMGKWGSGHQLKTWAGDNSSEVDGQIQGPAQLLETTWGQGCSRSRWPLHSERADSWWKYLAWEFIHEAAGQAPFPSVPLATLLAVPLPEYGYGSAGSICFLCPHRLLTAVPVSPDCGHCTGSHFWKLLWVTGLPRGQWCGTECSVW